MVRYHIATGDGKAYYGVNYESYREAKAVLEFSQKRDPQAHIVEEEYHFTNADRIRVMTDDELVSFLMRDDICDAMTSPTCMKNGCESCVTNWLQQPVKEDAPCTPT